MFDILGDHRPSIVDFEKVGHIEVMKYLGVCCASVVHRDFCEQNYLCRIRITEQSVLAMCRALFHQGHSCTLDRYPQSGRLISVVCLEHNPECQLCCK
jgi:hypothetical protein